MTSRPDEIMRASETAEAAADPQLAALIARALGSAPQEPRLRFLSGLAEARAGRPENARRIWQALLSEAPPQAPWRGVVERQLQTLP